MPEFAAKEKRPHPQVSANPVSPNKVTADPSRQTELNPNLRWAFGPQAVLQLQRANPNSLSIGAETSYEREADHIAEQVMRMPALGLQREKCACGGSCSSCEAKASQSGALPVSQPGLEQQPLQTKHIDSSHYAHTAAPPIVHEVLVSPGQPLDLATRDFMEPRFGYDLSEVRLHTDQPARESARALDALAYTVGRHVIFGEGQYSPTSMVGRRLLAHELTHVTQQNDHNQISERASAGSEMPASLLQRQATQSTPPARVPHPAPAPPVTRAGLNRTLYIVQNDVWNKLPKAIRDSAEAELNRLFAFVGQASTEKAFSIKVVAAAQMPQQYDFSESVVAVIHGDTASYVQIALDLQEREVRRWLAAHDVQAPAPPARTDFGGDPGRLGTGGENKRVTGSHAIPVMTGAVSIDEVITTFLESIDSFVSTKLEKLAGKGRDPTKWPAEVTSGPSKWRPLEMLGIALARAIAHEARHEYMGAGHAAAGLGEDAANIIDEKSDENFSADDQRAIFDRIKALEAQQGRATVVPTFPSSSRSKPELFPF